MDFNYGMSALIFWRKRQPIVDVETGKNYIRAWSGNSGTYYKIYRGESPVRYFLALVVTTGVAVFAAAVIFDFYKFKL